MWKARILCNLINIISLNGKFEMSDIPGYLNLGVENSTLSFMYERGDYKYKVLHKYLITIYF
jgi:hypothetical protein